MYKRTISAIFLLASVSVAAGPELSVKIPNPDDLGHFAEAAEQCLITDETLKAVAETVFNRSRISLGKDYSAGAICRGGSARSRSQFPVDSPRCRLTVASIKASLHVALTCSGQVVWASYKTGPLETDIAYSTAEFGEIVWLDAPAMNAALKNWVEDEIIGFVRVNLDSFIKPGTR